MKISPKLKQELRSFLTERIRKDQNRVTVFSADDFDADEKRDLVKKFSNLNWNEANYQVDKTVIAGVIIKVGSKTIDLSLMGSLSKLSNTLYEID